MSNKPKSNTMLCELQDTCKKRNGVCDGEDNLDCEFRSLCESMYTNEDAWIRPIAWNITDPPRFTEAQMALLKALWDIGARFLARDSVSTGAFAWQPYYDAEICEWQTAVNDVANVWVFENSVFNLNDMELLDLAEMFGKEKTE